MKKLFTQSLTLLTLLVLIFGYTARAQEQNKKDKPLTLKHWMTPEEAKLKHLIGIDASPTEAPEGPITNIAEFDKMQSVLIRYSFGIPYDLIAEMSQQCMVTTLVASMVEQTYVVNQYSNQGVKIENCDWIIAASDSYWTRDYGPWFVIDGNDELGIVDFTYNRPRPNDNAVPSKVAQEFGFNLFEMDIETAGGNYMTNGMGISSSSDLIWAENPGYSHEEIAQMFEDYLGIETYHVVDDPNNTYIDHIDCWGKFLDVDKVLIRSVPESHAQYDDIEATADYFASQTSSYGTPFQVFRVYTPNDQPYTNSLILNKRVFVPITNSQWDDEALASYEEAMPGYEVFGFTGSWESTDALHCRTKGVADKNMVHISHIALLGDQPVQTDYELEATIKAFSGANLNPDSVLVYYRMNGGDWQITGMTNTSGHLWSGSISDVAQGNQVDYYLYAADQDGNHLYHPFIGEPDPHVFFAGEQAFAHIDITPEELNAFAVAGQSTSVTLTICNTGALDLDFDISTQTAIYEDFEQTVSDSPLASAYDYNTWVEANWTEFEVEGSGEIAGLSIDYTWSTDTYPEEGSFHLQSPAGTEALIAAGNTAGTYTVDMIAFDEEEMNGTWRIWVEDSYGDGGHQVKDITVTFTQFVSEIEWLTVNPSSGTIAPGICVDIVVPCDASQLEAGMHEGMLIVASNDPDFPEVEVPVHFEVAESGFLTVAPDTLWFIDENTVWEGQTATILNNSSADVTISEIPNALSEFWYIDEMSQTLPHTLAPSEEMTINVLMNFIIYEDFVNIIYDSVQIVSDAGDYYVNLVIDVDLLWTAYQELDAKKINVYPSPFSQQLSIDLSAYSGDVNHVVITDLTGKIVKEFSMQDLSSEKLIWNCATSSSLKNGVYLIQVYAADKLDVIKVVKMD